VPSREPPRRPRFGAGRWPPPDEGLGPLGRAASAGCRFHGAAPCPPRAWPPPCAASAPPRSPPGRLPRPPQPLGYAWAGQELDAALAAHRRSLPAGPDAAAGAHAAEDAPPPPRLRPAALRRPLPAGTAACLLDAPAAIARAAVRDFAARAAPALPAVSVDVKERLPAAAGAAAAAAAAAGGGGRGGGGGAPGRGPGRRPRRTVMAEVPPSEWALAEAPGRQWRIAGGAAPVAGGEWCAGAWRPFACGRGGGRTPRAAAGARAQLARRPAAPLGRRPRALARSTAPRPRRRAPRAGL
jgi:hypothetical protein